MKSYGVNLQNIIMKSRILALLNLLILSLQAFSQTTANKDVDVYTVGHSWTYNGFEWSWTFEVDRQLYNYYRHERIHSSDDYNRYVFSEYDRQCIKDVVAAFRDAGEKAGYSDYDNVNNAVCFVQSLRYVTDMESRGEEEYVRYPIETLVDKEGDCEDVSVLLGSILDEMGYGVVFLHFPEHLALGVNCSDDFEGFSFPYKGERYYYLETTAKNWKIGSIPNEYKKEDAEVIPFVNKPIMQIESCGYHGDSYYMTDETVDFTLTCNYENTGPGFADDLYLHIIVKPQDNSNQMYFERYYKLDDLDEGESNQKIVQLKMPRPISAMIEFRIEGPGVDAKSMTVEGVRLK